MSKAQRQKFKGGGRYCSRDCKHLGVGDALRGQPLTGKLVTRHSAGYLLEWAPGHPRASRSRVLQHLLVMEAVLGRPLKPNEEVHHANGRRDDNWPDNLEVWVKGEHQRMHAQKPGVREAMSARMKRRVQARDGTSGRFVS